MLDLPTGDAAFEGFIHGRFVGREEERNRTRQFFHDILSSKILVASFIAHEIYQRLAANGAEEAEELGRVTKLLQETIDDISYGFEEPAMQAEIIPEPKRRASIVYWAPDGVWSKRQMGNQKSCLHHRNEPLM